MEVRVLRYFLVVVREESISKAAAVLHITQPTLSRQLAQMEEEAGVKLFDRGTRKISLTNEGILLRRRAEEIIELMDITMKELAVQEEMVEGEVSIGCGELASVSILSEMIRSFHQQYPQVTYDIFTANADQIKDRIDNGLTDIGLLLEPMDMEKYDYIRLPIKERWVVLMRPDGPLAQHEYVTAEQLAGHPIIMARRPGVKSELASWFGEHYGNLHILFTSNLSTNAAMMVQAGLGYSLVIEGSIPFLDQEKICCRPIYPELTSTSVLAWKGRQPFGKATAKFIEHIRKCLVQRPS